MLLLRVEHDFYRGGSQEKHAAKCDYDKHAHGHVEMADEKNAVLCTFFGSQVEIADV